MTTHVLHNTPVWLPQTQIWMYNQVRYLPPHIEAHVSCGSTENLDQFTVPNIHYFADQPVWKQYWDKGIRTLRLRRHLAFPVEVARRHRIDILHSHFGHEGWRDMEIARRAGLKHVVTFYGLDVNYLPRNQPVWLTRYEHLFRHVDAVLCEGPHMARCIQALGCPEEKVVVQRLGIAIDDIPFAPLAWRPGDPLKVLIAASFREKKGIPMALEALARLRARIPVEITVIGDAGAEPRAHAEKAKILDVIGRHNLTDAVRMMGYQPHSRMLEEARRHHIFLSPSITASDGDTEGGAPVSLIDMSASGMMVVGSTHCDIPEVVVDGKTGLLAQEGDLDGLVDRLEWAVGHWQDWETIRKAARKHVEGQFDAQIQAEKLAGIYQALLK